MTALQAKQILLAYRPWTNNAQDPEFAAALALCREDTELARWFEQHCAVQQSIRARLQATPPPDGLRQQIVSEHLAWAKVVWWRKPATMAMAAALVLFLALGAIWFNLRPEPEADISFATYRSRMVRTAIRAYGMDLETNNVAQIRAYLAQHQAHADYAAPANLDPAASVGCGVLSWQGQPVAMICFRTGKPLPPGAKSDLFLFVIDQKDVPDQPPGAPVIASVSKMATASWSNGGKIYILAGFDEADVRNRL